MTKPEGELRLIATLVVTLIVLAVSSVVAVGALTDRGKATNPCFPNHTCMPGLRCVTAGGPEREVCVDAPRDGGTDGR